MKELSIEEKAQAYDKAIKVASELHDKCKEGSQTAFHRVDLERMFPELAESEDERIRKELLAVIDDLILPNEQKERFIAWLEKQGEKDEEILVLKDQIESLHAARKAIKETYKIELEKQGKKKSLDNIAKEVIKDKDVAISFLKSCGIMNENGELADEYKIEQDEQKSAWSEEDEKKRKLLIAILKVNHPNGHFKVNPVDTLEMEAVSTNELVDWLESLEDIVQQEKSENIILKKLEEWLDEYVSDLADVSTDILICSFKNYLDGKLQIPLKDKVQPKQEWSEEDETKLKSAISLLKHPECIEDNDKIRAKTIEFLESLKDRVQPQNLIITDDELAQAKKDAYNHVLDKIEYHSGEPTFDDGWSAAIWYLKKRNIQPQPKQEWKQENTGDLTDFENVMMHIGGSFFGQHAGLDPNDTNAIKEQANLLLELVQSKEWSEKDKEMLRRCISATFDHGYLKECDWLKSIKDRVQLQNGYNPYKEVVESIAEMCKHYDKASHSGLRDFYDNVKVKCKDAKEYEFLFPQNTWKPSDEQIAAVKEAACYSSVFSEKTIDNLISLSKQLKKLREE